MEVYASGVRNSVGFDGDPRARRLLRGEGGGTRGKPLAAAAAAAARGLAEKLLCTQCHGAELQGQQHIPRLAGQQPDYL